MNDVQDYAFIKSVFIFILLITFFILPFSPYIAYILALLCLLFLSFNIEKHIVYLVFSVGCFAQLFILNSKQYILEKEFDLAIYYGTYLDLLHLSFSDVLINYAPEFGWHLLYKFIGVINPKLSIYHVAIINTLICEIGFIIWFYRHGKKAVSSYFLGLVLGLVLLFLWPNNFAFFQRQAVSVIFLLFAISNINKVRNFALYLSIATCFHLTSLPMGLIYFYLQKSKSRRIEFNMLIGAISYRTVFSLLLSVIISSLGFEALTRKANFYAEDAISFFFAPSELRFLPLFFFIFIFYRKTDNDWKKIALFSSIFYLSLIGLQFASGRMNFILFYLYGLFLFIFVRKSPFLMFSYVILYFAFDICYKSGIIFNISDNFWQRYPMISFEPFYYIK